MDEIKEAGFKKAMEALEAILIELVQSYFKFRGYTWPKTAQGALNWLVSEVGELSGVYEHSQDDYVRNNDHEGDKIEDEAGDVLQMFIVFTMMIGKGPVSCMIDKWMSKGWKPEIPEDWEEWMEGGEWFNTL